MQIRPSHEQIVVRRRAKEREFPVDAGIPETAGKPPSFDKAHGTTRWARYLAELAFIQPPLPPAVVRGQAAGGLDTQQRRSTATS